MSAPQLKTLYRLCETLESLQLEIAMQAAAMKQDMMAPNTCEYFIEKKEIVKENME